MKILNEIEDFIVQIKEISGYIWQMGWAEKNGGNFSIDITERIRKIEGICFKNYTKFSYLKNRVFIFKKKGSRFRDVAKNPEENIVIGGFKDNEFRIIFGDEPTSEILTHITLHNSLRKEDSKNYAILHTHPEYTIALSNIKGITEKKLNNILFNSLPEIKFFIKEGVGLINYEEPGSEKLGLCTLKKSKEKGIIIWKRHGTCVIDEDLKEAFDKTHILEKAAKISIVGHILNLSLTF